jgi:hypothetical protein
MFVHLYLPIAKYSNDLLFLLGLGGSVGFMSGLFGVGGGFLMTPLLIMIGIPPVVAAASDSNQIIGAAISGTYAHSRMGNVDFKMAGFLLIGAFIGGSLGVHIIKILTAMGDASFVIKIIYVVMLSVIGTFMFIESLNSLLKKPQASDEEDTEKRATKNLWLTEVIPGKMHFPKSGLTFSPVVPMLAGGLVGTLASILGVGGGFMMVPLMYYVLRMPMRLVVGTNLLQEVFLCANVTVMQVISNHSVDLVLAMILLVGSSIGAQFGARASHRLHADQLRFLLAIIVLLVMVKIFFGLTLHPHFLLDMKGL